MKPLRRIVWTVRCAPMLIFPGETIARDGPPGASTDAAVAAEPALGNLMQPGTWVRQAGCTPPPPHRPGRLLAAACMPDRMAVSLRTATLLAANLGMLVFDRLAAAECRLDPLAGLALHEVLVNAAIHGNLRIASGPAHGWHDLATRHDMIRSALREPALAARIVSLAVGWNAQRVYAAVIDEGAGYAARATPRPDAALIRHGAGRGLMIARAAGSVHVSRGGRCTTLIFARLAPAVPG